MFSSAEAIDAFNTGLHTVKLHGPYRVPTRKDGGVLARHHAPHLAAPQVELESKR
jgi:hypothetical protein